METQSVFNGPSRKKKGRSNLEARTSKEEARNILYRLHETIAQMYREAAEIREASQRAADDAEAMADDAATVLELLEVQSIDYKRGSGSTIHATRFPAYCPICSTELRENAAKTGEVDSTLRR